MMTDQAERIDGTPRSESRPSSALPLTIAAFCGVAILILAAPLGVVGAAARAATFVATLAAIGLCIFARLAHDRAGIAREELALRRAVLVWALVGVVASFGWLAVELAE